MIESYIKIKGEFLQLKLNVDMKSADNTLRTNFKCNFIITECCYEK